MKITQRIDNITHLPAERRASVLPMPKSVKIELTARCNFRCTFCARSERLRDQRDMDRALYSRLIREMREAGVEELGLFYLGESFLIKWLPEAIKEAKDVGFPYVFLTTNGSIATAERTRACFEAGLDSLKFSFNYSDGKQLANIARVKEGIWNQIVENIIDAAKERNEVEARTGHRCGLYASYIHYDDEQDERLAPLVEWLGELIDEVYALPLYNQAGLCKAKLKEAHSDWKQTAGNMGRRDAMVAPLPCWAVFAEGHISYKGLMSACCFDHDEKFTMADLRETPFVEGWNSEKYQALRAAHLKEDVTGTVCEKCVAWN